MKRAIVLSGGGSKGAYQIGVWKALKKMHIDYDIVTGTSVGALNAALMIQKNYYRAVWLWHNLDFSIVFDEKIDFDYNSKDGKKELMKFYAKNIVNGGTNVTKLEQTISKTVNIDKIYKSKIDMGIVTVKLPTLKPITLTKNQMPKNRLKDYLIASASCYPAFQKKNINGSNYIDGGFYDNLPINLAIDMGAEEVIAIDLKEVGFKQKVKDKSVKVKIVSPRNDIGSFLVFDKNMARRCIKLGYNDTMKEFTLLEGNKYTFKKSSFDKFYEQYKEIYIDYLKRILKIEKDTVDRYLKKKDKELYKIEYDGYLIGAVFSERYRSELGNYLSSIHPELDLVVMINMSGGLSLRTEKDIDISILAQKLNGGGHKKACGAPIEEEVKESILKNIFKDCKIKEIPE